MSDGLTAISFPEANLTIARSAPPATHVLVAGSRGGYAHVVNEK